MHYIELVKPFGLFSSLLFLAFFVSTLYLVHELVNKILSCLEIYMRGIGGYSLKKFWLAGFASNEYFDRSRRGAIDDVKCKGKGYVLEYFNAIFDTLREQYVQGHKLDAVVTDNGNGTAKVTAVFIDEDGNRDSIVVNVPYTHLFSITSVFPALLMSKSHRAGDEYIKA